YQDTNKIQERIIKNVAKNSNFVAVGDVKQGIYGFRLASSEIFLKDQKDFQEDVDSAVNFLKSNFRSSPKVLDFVNDVFKVCMTEDVTGVDYENSSMLKGEAEYVEEAVKPINIDLVAPTKTDAVELGEVYSVKEAQTFSNNKNILMLKAIKKRISDVLSSEIYIEKEKAFRKCCYSDIAILSRKRDDLFNELEDYLQKNGVPVVSKSRNYLLDEVEIQVLLNYLKIALNMDDDVACLSVILSGLGDFTAEQIVEAKSESDKTLCQIVLEDENKVFEKFNQNLREFRQNLLVVGAKKAFLDLFLKTNYRAFINSKTNQRKLNMFIDKFLSEIEKSGLEYDLPGLINYFESVDITVTADANNVEDAVLLTTIHNSKGLEYPIVFLINCDQSLSKTRPKVDIQINEQFGLGVKFYDLENNSEIKTVRMKAIQESEKQKDFAEELMIFYVALTRAKNRIYMFGEFDESLFEKHNVKACDSYFDLVFFALKNINEKFLENMNYEDENMSVRYVEDVIEMNNEIEINEKDIEKDQKIIEKLKKYLDFQYILKESSNFKLKETVTSLNNKFKEDLLHTYSNESFSFGGATVEVGNAYHLVLKNLDFAKISDLKDLKEQVNNLS
ncbi:MAG: UvrD-helicase domain-containing protein, partial [Clostridia bacterium]|nr:UvrD-helicase domain-containing protein [Clostridia bacterium]